MNKLITLISFAALAGCSSGSNTVAGSEAGNSKIGITIVTADKKPAVHVPVILYSSDGSKRIDSLATDSVGFVEFSDVPIGKYQITAKMNNTNLFVPITLTEQPILITDTLTQETVIRVDRSIPLFSGLALKSTPFYQSSGKIESDSTILFTGFPEGTFRVELIGTDLTLVSTDSITLVSGDTIDCVSSQFEVISSKLKPPYLGGMLFDSGMILFSKDSLVKYQYGTATTYVPGNQIKGTTLSAAYQNGNSLFIGTDSGVSVYESSLFSQFQPTTSPIQFNSSHEGFISLCSYYKGVTTFTNGTYSDLLESGINTVAITPTCSYPENDSSIFIGTNCRGVYHWVKGKPLVVDTSFTGAKSLIINDIFYDKDSSLWICSSSSLKRRVGGTWSTLVESIGFNGLTSDSHGNLWFGASNGKIYRWNGTTLDSPFTLSSEIHSLSSLGNYLLAVTANSVVLMKE